MYSLGDMCFILIWDNAEINPQIVQLRTIQNVSYYTWLLKHTRSLLINVQVFQSISFKINFGIRTLINKFKQYVNKMDMKEDQIAKVYLQALILG